jgi:hypothetical protein
MTYPILIGVVAVVAITAVYFVWVRKSDSGEQPPQQ